MSDTITDSQIIFTPGGWVATPWNYSSLRWLRLPADGYGELTYGYGQSIYAIIRCEWELVSFGLMRLTYTHSPSHQRFQGFTPDDTNRRKELKYRLIAGEVTGVESIVILPYRYLWTLELSASPWPTGLELPHEPPIIFYGHGQKAEATA